MGEADLKCGVYEGRGGYRDLSGACGGVGGERFVRVHCYFVLPGDADPFDAPDSENEDEL